MDRHTWPVQNGTATLTQSPFGCEIKIRNVNGVVVNKFTGKTEAEVRAACEAQYPPTIEAHQAAYEAWQTGQANGTH